MCHLHVRTVLDACLRLDPPEREVLVENLAILFVTALFNLDEVAKAIVASLAEGDDKTAFADWTLRMAQAKQEVSTMPAYQFTIQFLNEHGTLAALLESLAAGGVELRAIGTGRIGQQGVAVLIPNDDEAARKVLLAQGYEFVEGEVLITSTIDQPGAIAALARQLTNAGINVRGLLTLGWHQGKAELALSVDDLPAAQKLLGT